MASAVITLPFKQSLLVAGHTWKLALYHGAALDDTIAAYTAVGEVAGAGYVAGGKALTNVTVSLDGTTVILDADDVTWPNSTITADQALLYDVTTGIAVSVISFGGDVTSTNGTFTAPMPAAAAATALVHID